MALGKYSKVDWRKSSNSNCSTVILVAFMALCLVGVWLMASSSIVPFQNLYTTYGINNDVIASEGKVMNKSSNENSESSEDTITIKANNSKQFEDNSHDLPKDTTNRDTNVNSHEDINSKENTQVPKTTLEGDNTHGKQEDSIQDTSISEIAKGKEKQGDDEFKADNRDYKEVEKRSDSESRKYGRQVENHENGKGITNENKVDAPPNEKIFPFGDESEILNETYGHNGLLATQTVDSIKSKEAQIPIEHKPKIAYQWKLCNVTAGPDFIPCLDNLKAIKSLRSTNHYQHRERHCPLDPPTCLVPLPEGYQRPIPWPTSRQKIWYNNVPHTKLVEFKRHQNWVRATGKYLTFPGGGTQFKRGAIHYIDFIQETPKGAIETSSLMVVLFHEVIKGLARELTCA
ncbi:hypothetical protein OSB04_011450 [Centaurea solstitialis]|uniref:Methyltransferase n=1 Tax=Centaurea solstitialis TaxID=347529 RepID=A0AA38WQ36_9ASTR|nr:hypothetical protein OSB04_011450 [Centaurea solstitialis]